MIGAVFVLNKASSGVLSRPNLALVARFNMAMVAAALVINQAITDSVLWLL